MERALDAVIRLTQSLRMPGQFVVTPLGALCISLVVPILILYS